MQETFSNFIISQLEQPINFFHSGAKTRKLCIHSFSLLCGLKKKISIPYIIDEEHLTLFLFVMRLQPERILYLFCNVNFFSIYSLSLAQIRNPDRNQSNSTGKVGILVVDFQILK